MTNLRELLHPPVHRPMLPWGLSIACLVVAAVVGGRAWRYEQHADRIQQDLARLQARRQAPPPVQPSKVDVDAQRRWDALAAERAFNWYPIFRALEQASSADIELLEFLPDKVGRHIVLRGEARTDEALTHYLAALAMQDSFGEVHLTHQKKGQRAGLSPLSFEIRATILIVK